MKITADRELCVSAGMCALTASEHFDQDDEEGRVVLLADEVEEGDDNVRQAVQLCPSGAISLH